MTKTVFLTMSDELYEALANKRTKNGYLTTQELINDIIRKTLFGNTTKVQLRKSNAGRPPGINEEKIIHTKKIFR